MRYLILLALLAPAVEAQELRPGDVALTDAEITELIVGRTHTFFDGGVSFFSVTDSYSYTYTDGGVAYGRYERGGPGQVCTYFDHGFERCDTYVRANERLVLITEDGTRFPIREVN